jgi:hypothetical protein
MDVAPDTWDPPKSLIPRAALRGIPHHGLGRGFKTGKEEIAGLLVALERFATLDVDAELAASQSQLAALAEELAGVPHVRTRLRPARETGRAPLLELAFDEAALGRRTVVLSRALQQGEPSVHLSEREASRGILLVDPSGSGRGTSASSPPAFAQAWPTDPSSSTCRPRQKLGRAGDRQPGVWGLHSRTRHRTCQHPRATDG